MKFNQLAAEEAFAHTHTHVLHNNQVNHDFGTQIAWNLYALYFQSLQIMPITLNRFGHVYTHTHTHNISA